MKKEQNWITFKTITKLLNWMHDENIIAMSEDNLKDWIEREKINDTFKLLD